MTFYDLTELFKRSSRRYALIGDRNGGVLAGLDLGGRLFAVLDGEVLNRVNSVAFEGQSSAEEFLNPGGDGLWPAPEGTSLGYEYTTGNWRVPPSITGARYRVLEAGTNHAHIRAEIDLINNIGIGLPTIFERDIQIEPKDRELIVKVKESITYVGTATIDSDKFLLAPWSLCQFDSGKGAEVVFPDVAEESLWDLYDSSETERRREDGLWHTRTDAGPRYQVALDSKVDWIEFRYPKNELTVRRTAEPVNEGFEYIDIRDAAPTEQPATEGVRFSVYSDPNGFMEIEAVGGSPNRLKPGCTSAVLVTTTYRKG